MWLVLRFGFKWDAFREPFLLLAAAVLWINGVIVTHILDPYASRLTHVVFGFVYGAMFLAGYLGIAFAACVVTFKI